MGFINKLSRQLRRQAFGVPSGLLGRIGGRIMAGQRQRRIANHIADLLDVRPGDKVLEIGFGPGVGIQCINERLAGQGLIVGIDPSEVMLHMAGTRNAQAIENGTVSLLNGIVEKIPFEREFFDKAYSMNSFQIWPDKLAGLREIHRVQKDEGQLVLSFYGPAKRAITPESMGEQLARAGFREISDTVDEDSVLYVVSRK